VEVKSPRVGIALTDVLTTMVALADPAPTNPAFMLLTVAIALMRGSRRWHVGTLRPGGRPDRGPALLLLWAGVVWVSVDGSASSRIGTDIHASREPM
jgi:hypothetical protein